MNVRLDSDESNADAPSSGCWPVRGYGSARARECGCVYVTWRRQALARGPVTLYDRTQFRMYVPAHVCVADMYLCVYICQCVYRYRAKTERPCSANTSVSDKQRPLSAMTSVSCGSFGRPLSPSPLEQLILAEDTSMQVMVPCVCLHHVRTLSILWWLHLDARSPPDTAEAVPQLVAAPLVT